MKNPILMSLVPLAALAAFAGRPVDQPPAHQLPAEIVAMAQETRAGGLFALEVDSTGKILAYEAEIDPALVPANLRELADKTFPGGKVTGAEKEVIGGASYFEIQKEIDGLAAEILMTADGKVAGTERQIRPESAPPHVVPAANALVPEGEIVAVERIEGAEGLGGVEHHVKKKVNGEVLRIRVREKDAVEVLRKLKAELKVPRKK